MLSVTVEELLVTVRNPGLLGKQSHSPQVPTGVPSDSGPPPEVTLKLLVFALPVFLSLRNAAVVWLVQNLGCGQGSVLSVCFQVAPGSVLVGCCYLALSIGLLTLAGSLPPHNEWAIS